ncbi:RNA ligase [Chryseolinea serpens]|uniref:RNA ligase n=1 Tax=Chryseolinea serpens TaxID=947013 RepID=A0A1M5XB83_9BACT|nr:RNA ligase family protein [Chryseolinea serpens]SHH97071.1 RNA ligase [Chryseolinea serpens]
MKEYHKIQTVFLRTPESKFKTLMEGHWALPEFEVLKDIPWIWTEKIDGTNIRIQWNGQEVRFGGKTDDAHIPTFLLNVLQTKFTTERMKTVFPDATEVCLYGEGYGAKIQKGSHYLPDRTDFILFDCKIDSWWLARPNLEDIANKLSIGVVPIMGMGTLLQAVEFVKQGYKSTIAHNKNYDAEGLIMKPAVELFNRQGQRIVSKIKFRDFIR